MIITLAQINPIVGDLEGNYQKIVSILDQYEYTHLVIFPEMALLGYPPQDLLLDDAFIEAVRLYNNRLMTHSTPFIVGTVIKDSDQSVGKQLYNTAMCSTGYNLGVDAVNDHTIHTTFIHKTHLPTYDVFDEKRYFRSPEGQNNIWECHGKKIAVTICEDMWIKGEPFDSIYKQNPDIIVNISASPWYSDKPEDRWGLAAGHMSRCTAEDFIYVNQIGGQDELIFDGASFVWSRKSSQDCELPQLQLPAFEEQIKVFDTKSLKEGANILNDSIQRALVLGIQDYCRKNGFKRVVIGLSGGIDSAVVACLAAEALGPKNVTAISMPTDFSSIYTKQDARELAAKLKIQFNEVNIQKSIDHAKERFSEHFSSYLKPITLENLQARERGKLLMEFSNDFDALLLSTGNKTELGLGYSTLYGDLCGGLGVIGDLNKQQVYELAACYPQIPGRIIVRKPSAELSENQVDPFDYEKISPVVDGMIDGTMARWQVEIRLGKEESDRLYQLLSRAEFKRKQAPPVLKVSKKAFGTGRKFPITNGWKP